MNLDPAEADALARDAHTFASALPDQSARDRYLRLATTVAESNMVPDDLVAAVETMLELLFERGKPSNPAVLQSVYAKTPRGRTLTTAARDVNQALQALRGQTIETIRVTAAPSRHTLTLETTQARITIELDRSGARVASLET